MRPLLAALAALLLMASSLHAETPVAEPDGLWQGAMHGTTPKTLKARRWSMMPASSSFWTAIPC